MKIAILGTVFYLLLVFMALCSCEQLHKDEAKDFIPGTYTRHYKDEYTDSYDTITISPTSNDHFLVIKKSRFQKINNEKNWSPGTEVRKWLGSYDKRTVTLFLSPPGKTVFFYPKSRQLKIGTTPYKKL